jgi:DegV family protein with EDD domain
MLRTAIIVDAACDLPPDFIEQHGIFVVPFHILTQTNLVVDARNPELTDTYYQTHLSGQSADYARTEPLMSDELEQFFLRNIVLKFDQAIFMTLAASRSELNKNISNAWFAISSKCFKLRREQGLKGSFSLEVIDSNTLGPGQGLLAYAAVSAARAGHQVLDIKNYLTKIRNNIFVYGVPADLLYMYTRAKEKNERSITWGKYTLATMLGVTPIIKFHYGESAAVGRTRGLKEGLIKILDYAQTDIFEKIQIGLINISYSGDLNEILTIPEYRAFCLAAQHQNIEVMLSKMSLTVAINLGKQALMVSFCAPSSHFE